MSFSPAGGPTEQTKLVLRPFVTVILAGGLLTAADQPVAYFFFRMRLCSSKFDPNLNCDRPPWGGSLLR